MEPAFTPPFAKAAGANQIVARKWWVETPTTASAPVRVSTDRNVSDNLKYIQSRFHAGFIRIFS